MSDLDNTGFIRAMRGDVVTEVSVPTCCSSCGRTLIWKQRGKTVRVFDDQTGNPLDIWMERLHCDNPQWFHTQPRFYSFEEYSYFERTITLDLITEEQRVEDNWSDSPYGGYLL